LGREIFKLIKSNGITTNLLFKNGIKIITEKGKRFIKRYYKNKLIK